MADEDFGTGSITITLDDSSIDAEANRLGDRIERVLNRASREAGLRMQRNIRAAVRRITPIKISVEADLRSFITSVQRVGDLPSVDITLEPDVDRAVFEAAINKALSGLTVSVRVIPDLTGFNAAIRAHRVPPVTVDVNANTRSFTNSLSRLGGVASRVGSGLRGFLAFGAVGIAAAGAAQSIIALTAALAPAAGLIAAGPAVILGYAAAVGTLRLALVGVSDAFSAALTGTAEEFNKSLEQLSPAAQAAANEVRALRPAFDELRSAVQDAFFQQIEGDITRAATALQGPLLSSLTAVSAAWGIAARGVLSYVQSSQGVSNVNSILGATQLGVEGLASTTNQLTAGFLQAAASISDAFGARFGTAISNAGQSFATFLQNAANSGQAVAWVEGALTVLKQLGGVLSNVGSALSGVFKAGSDVGAGFLSNLQAITASFSQFVNSAKGQEAIGAIFSTLGTIAAQLGPIFSALVAQIGAIAPALAPVFEALGPALTGLINALGPALAAIAPSLQTVATGLATAFKAIGPALAPVGTAIGSLLSALAPLLPVIGQLVAAVATALAPVITALAGALKPVIAALAGALTPILPPLTTAFVTLANALKPLIILIGTTLGQVITALAPILTTLVGVITQVVTAFAPLITQLVEALTPILPPIVAAFSAIVQAILPLVPVLVQLVTAMAPFVALVISALAPIIQFAAEILKWVTLNAVVPIIQTIVSVLTTIIGAVTNVLGRIASFVPSVISFFSNLGSNVSSLVSGLVNSVVGFFGSLPGRALSAVSSLVSFLAGLFGRARDAVVSRVRSLVGDAVSFLSGLPEKARASLGNIGSALVSAGGDLVRGLINGIKALAGSVVDAAQGVVRSAIDGAKSLLGISSPSKVFAEIGKFTGEGFIKGFEGTEKDIQKSAQQAVDRMRGVFEGGRMSVVGSASVIADPFRDNTTTGTLGVRGGRRVDLPGSGQTTVNNFTINEVGDAEVTAQRVLNRLTLAGGSL